MEFARWCVIALALPAAWAAGLSAAHAQDDDGLKTELRVQARSDVRYFVEPPVYEKQHQVYFSQLFQPELNMRWNGGKQLIQATGFIRLDAYDPERTHVDLRELYYQAVFSKWEFSLGFKKIFWGVTESNHLVDVINQSDGLEGFDLEQKLGQPMAHVSFAPSWGTVDLFMMPLFRQMRFPGENGRLRPPFLIDYDHTLYESDAAQKHIDWAARWSHSVGVFDIGLSHFYGTSRLPLFTTSDFVNFVPFYELMHQSGLDLQVSTGPMLWKTEAIYRESERKIIRAVVAGGEYTFSNLFRSGADLGLILEYTYDDRGAESINGLNDDIFVGLRLAVNDVQSTDFLGGFILDDTNGTLRYYAEASRRLDQSLKIGLEVAGFGFVDPSEFLYLIRKDTYVQLSLTGYF